MNSSCEMCRSIENWLSISRYKDLHVGNAYRLDFTVDRKVVVELKVVDGLLDGHRAQLLSYLPWADCRLGLLLNFHALQMRQVISHVVNQL